MIQKTTLFVFFLRASGGPQVVSTSSPEVWIEKARQRVNAPNAEVILIEQADWDAPKLTSFNDAYLRSNFPIIVKGIQKALISHGVPEIPPQELLDKIDVMGSDLTRLLVLIVKYIGEFSSGSKSMGQVSPTKKNLLSRLFGIRDKVHQAVGKEERVIPESTKGTSSGGGYNWPFTEKDNRGTRYDTESNAIWGWQRRLNLGGKSPFVTYTFDNEKAAKEAFLELPCFHMATDSQKLICTEVLEFAYFQTSDGKYDVGIWGDELTYKLWELAKLSFSKHGGQMKDQLEPEKGVAKVSKKEVMQFNKVKFVYIQEKPQEEKEEIIERLRSVAGRCGDFSFMIEGIANAIETGVDPYGKDAPSHEEIAALAGFAEMLEKEGKKSEAIELVFIAKAIQNIIKK